MPYGVYEHSEEHKEKTRKHLKELHKKNDGKSWEDMYGIEKANQIRAKRIIFLKEFYKNKKNHPFYGKKHKPEDIEKMRTNKGKKFSEETKEKMRIVRLEYIKNHPNWQKGENNSMYGIRLFKEKNHFYGKKHTEETRKILKIHRMKRVIPKKDNKIEKAVQEVLKNNDIVFKTHEPILGQPDIFIEPNICIFVDGCYWHSCPIHCPETYSLKKRLYDDRINMKLQEMNYKVVRLWEHDIDKYIFERIKYRIEKSSDLI